MDVRARYESDDVSWLEGPDREVESPWIERKAWCDAKEIARQVCGFANGKPPGGLFVLGAESSGAIKGIDDREEAVDERLAALRDLVEGHQWEYRRVNAERRTLLFLFVPFSERRVVCLSDGSAHRRVGPRTFEMKLAEVTEQRDARGEIHFEDELCCPFSEDVLDEVLCSAFVEELRARNGLTLPLDLPHALANRKLARGSPLDLTNAAVLALGRDPSRWLPGARIRFLRFEGRDERFGTQRNVVKDQSFEGAAIPRLIERFREFMKTQVREFDYLGQNGLFVHEPEYPEFAWDEAIVNALVHRSYTLSNASVFVRVFDDRIEVESPGAFPGTVHPPESLYSLPRNPNLAGALEYMKLVRLAREGTQRMQREMADMGLPPPEFEEVMGASHVRVTLRNDIERRRARDGSEVPARKWAEIEELLRDDLTIRRDAGVRAWENLAANNAVPPPTVVDAALQLFRSRDEPMERLQLTAALLSRAPGGLVERAALQIVEDFVSGAFEDQSNAAIVLAGFLSRAEAAAAIVLQSVETGTLPPAMLRQAFMVLRQASLRTPLPPRQWLDRVLKACELHAALPDAQSLYLTIKGKPLNHSGS